MVQDFELQRQLLCALNVVLYEQLQFKGNERDYYNPLNSYLHQVCDHTLSLISHTEIDSHLHLHHLLTPIPDPPPLPHHPLFRCFCGGQAFQSASLCYT